jgi:hypothetical protein
MRERQREMSECKYACDREREREREREAGTSREKQRHRKGYKVYV